MSLHSRIDKETGILLLRSARLNPGDIHEHISQEVRDEIFAAFRQMAVESQNLVFYDRFLDHVVEYPLQVSHSPLFVINSNQLL